MSRRKGKKGMRKSQSESGMLPQMYSDNGSNDMGMGTDGRPRRIFQKKMCNVRVRAQFSTYLLYVSNMCCTKKPGF